MSQTDGAALFNTVRRLKQMHNSFYALFCLAAGTWKKNFAISNCNVILIVVAIGKSTGLLIGNIWY